MWRRHITLHQETYTPPTTCTGKLSACLCKTKQEEDEEDGNDMVLKAHRNPWDTPTTTPSSSVESSFNGDSYPMTVKTEEKKPSIVVLDVDL